MTTKIPTKSPGRQFRRRRATGRLDRDRLPRSIGHTHAEEDIRVEASPVVRVVPQSAHALARVEHKTAVPPRPGLRSLDFAHRPLDPRAINDHVRVRLLGRPAMRGKDMAASIDAPGHQITYDCAGEDHGDQKSRPLHSLSSHHMECSCRARRLGARPPDTRPPDDDSAVTGQVCKRCSREGGLGSHSLLSRSVPGAHGVEQLGGAKRLVEESMRHGLETRDAPGVIAADDYHAYVGSDRTQPRTSPARRDRHWPRVSRNRLARGSDAPPGEPPARRR
jgi:hypothetical protein